jgi:NAD(P)-dependent dehydrogenase (short-subunit alcohol dehydrogenase family)
VGRAADRRRAPTRTTRWSRCAADSRLGRLVECAEVADAICYLAADSTFTTGADFLLDGGITSMRVVG